MSRFRSYAQLLRLPNVFTAWADIVLGTLVGWQIAPAAGEAFPWLALALLLAASTSLYSAGMVWNDVCDLEQDRRERPFRPIPSGRVSRRHAGILGTMLLLTGVGLAALAGWRFDAFDALPVTLAGGLVAAILLYDAWLKRTWAGPLGMGACRFLNVLLGLAVVEAPIWRLSLFLAFVVGLYIVGVTWFARTEARLSNQGSLTAAAGVMLASLGLALLLPALPIDGHASRPASANLFPYALVLFGYLIGYPIVLAIRQPAPARVQCAVKRCVLGLVVLDAVLATGLVGVAGLLILLLLPPALFLGRWIYST